MREAPEQRSKVVMIGYPERIAGVVMNRYSTKSIYHKKNRENYHGGKNEM